jgi:hypothetical protein
MQRRYPQLCMRGLLIQGGFGGLPAGPEDWMEARVSVSVRVCNKCMQAGKVLFRKVQTGPNSATDSE